MDISRWLDLFFFGVYPYIALTVCVLGCWARFDLSQYTWKTGSSQMLSDTYMRLGSNLFHVGILVVLTGHLIGMFTPHALYEHFISAPQKQLMAILVGGVFGVMCLVGLLILLWRRFTNPRVSHTSTWGDKMLLVLILVQLLLGLATIWTSKAHMDGVLMMGLADWAQQLALFNPVRAVNSMQDAGMVYRLHMVLGTTLVLITPFTRLIHIISAPIWYLGRRYQIVRQRG